LSESSPVRRLNRPNAKNLSRNAFAGVYFFVREMESEDDLVIRVQQGDLTAFERLLNLHSSHLRAFVAMKLPIPHLIDEIAHETFVFSHRHIMDFKAGTDFGKWLRAIAFNLIRKETLRHQRLATNRDKFLEHHFIQQSGLGDLSPELPLVIYLEECLNRLPEQQRKLLEHKYSLAESSREIASAFQQSEAWVRTTLCRVRTALRQCIENKIAGSPEPV
jgi:RNA polymerase sigma-70 factor, ECF subfamily